MSNGVVVRKSVDSLSPDELTALRNGFRQMQAINDNRGYNYLAGLHGTPGNYCWHLDQPPLVLPWHRAYLYTFEQFLRDQIPTLSVPWWDWTSSNSRTSGLPLAFSAPTTKDDQPNPLYKFRINVPNANPPLNRDTRRFPRSPGTLPLPSEVRALLDLSDFRDFTVQVRQIHNRIHGWVGGLQMDGDTPINGDMGLVATAAFDPIFFPHHSMIDRIWYLWQVKHGNNNVPQEILETVLQPFNMSVAEVLDINRLGYQYAVGQVSIIVGS